MSWRIVGEWNSISSEAKGLPRLVRGLFWQDNSFTGRYQRRGEAVRVRGELNKKAGPHYRYVIRPRGW